MLRHFSFNPPSIPRQAPCLQYDLGVARGFEGILDSPECQAADAALPFHHSCDLPIFEVDLRACELRRDGRKVRVREQPFLLTHCLVGLSRDLANGEICQTE
jgi:hypothetical protein